MTNFLKMHFLLSVRQIFTFLIHSIREQNAEVPWKLGIELFICQQKQHAEERTSCKLLQVGQKKIYSHRKRTRESSIQKIFYQMHWYNFQHVNSSYSQEPLISSQVFSHNSKLYSIQPQEVGFFLHCSPTFFLHVTD